MVIDSPPISAAQFADLADDPQYQEVRVELVNGEIITMPKPKQRHGITAGRFYRHLDKYAQEHGGIVDYGETGIVTRQRPDGRDTVRGLDVAYRKITPDDIADPDDFIREAPDVIVEVISPGNEILDMDHKIAEYQAMGTPLIWVVNPVLRTVMAYAGEDVRRYTVEDTLDAGDVLPGFAVPLREFFPL